MKLLAVAAFFAVTALETKGISFNASNFIVTNLVPRSNRDILAKGVDYFCVKRLHLDREHLENALNVQQLLNEKDMMVIKFLSCSWNLSGRIFNNGRINFSKIIKDLMNGFVKSGVPLRRAQMYSAIMANSCKREQDAEAAKISKEFGLIKVANCIYAHLVYVGEATDLVERERKSNPESLRQKLRILMDSLKSLRLKIPE